MLQADQLLDHAAKLLAFDAGTETDYRRAVSSSYYAVFHLLSSAVAEQVCPAEPPGLRGRCQRALEHRAMKNAMSPFRTVESCAVFSKAIGVPCIFSIDLAEIAQAFADLQDARHAADYDVEDSEGIVGFSWASDCLERAIYVFNAWRRVNGSTDAKLFLASLAFGSKWGK